MFRRTLIHAALALAPAAGFLGAAPAAAQGLSALNPICKDLFGSTQQPRPPFETREIVDGGTRTILNTPAAMFPPGDSFGPNPTNLLPTVYENAQTCRGTPIPNTLPSTPENPYNLHDDPVVTEIDPTSPLDDLDMIMDEIEALMDRRENCQVIRGRETCKTEFRGNINTAKVRQLAREGIDIVEGNPLTGRLAGREYEGFPLLHYLGGLKTKAVDPVTRNITINQIWHDSHIEADVNYIDPSAVQDEEWTITYNVKILNRGHEDFAPYAMFYDDPKELDLTDVGGPDLTEGGTKTPRIPNVAMDQTFFPMEEGLQYTLKMKMPPARFWNLTYHWGWRQHPPRVQVVENVLASLPNGMPRNSAEIGVFGENPRASEEAKLAAIDMIGDLAPAKRMWRIFGELAQNPPRNGRGLSTQMYFLRQAFHDWQNRKKLPTGFKMADDADITLVYLNNTIYGELRGHDGDAEVRATKLWNNRGDQIKLELLNGDYYLHAYVLVDFGGLRGWENTFHNTLKLGGAGPLFTFGRNHWWIQVAGGGPIMVPPAERVSSYGPGPRRNEYTSGKAFEKRFKGDRGDYALGSWGGRMDPVARKLTATGLGAHRVDINLGSEPSRRLRLYQFDPLHHDVAVWSVH